MKVGTRFRVVRASDADIRDGIRVGCTGHTLETGNVPWCHMDSPTTFGTRFDHLCKAFGVPSGHLACLLTSQIEGLPGNTAKAPRKAPAMRETSLQAHESQKDKAPSDRATILGRVTQSPMGITCDALEQGLGLSHQTASARLNDLVRMGKIKDSGRREATRTGRKAICWVVVA